MKKYRLVSALILAAAFTACTQDEPFSAAGDANSGEALPEGMYPLQIGSISVFAEGSGQPWTRVAETADGTSSTWEGNEQISVQIGTGTPGTYAVDASGNATAVTPAYWQSTAEGQTVTAWYPASANGSTVTLSDQTEDLAYVLKATATANFNNTVSLDFKHQLAKVRVELSGLRASKVTSVSLNGCSTECTSNQGSVSEGSETGDIQMRKVEGATVFEANVLPGEKISTITLNDNIECSLTSSITTAAGAMHKVSLQVNANGIPADATLITTSNCTDIKGTGKYVVSGTFSNKITVTSGSPHIYLDKATVSVSGGNAINIEGGNPTIHVVGENTLKNSKSNGNSYSNGGAGIYVADGSTVTITGNSRTDDVLTVQGACGGCGIGGYLSGLSTAHNSGNIVIKDVTISATGSYDSMDTCSPAIGAAGSGSCGTITIDNATVDAKGVYAASSSMSSSAIGAGINYYIYYNKGTYGTITIKNNSVVNVQRGNSYSDYIGSSGAIDNQATGATDATTDGTSKVTKLN